MSIGKSSNIFDSGYQVLFIAPIIGTALGIKSDKDSTSASEFTIAANQMITNRDKFQRIYNIVMLADRSENLTPDERVDFVFRSEDEADTKKGKEIFDLYTLGGIEWLYNKIVKDGKSADDYLNRIISAVQDYSRELGVYSDEELKVLEEQIDYL